MYPILHLKQPKFPQFVFEYHVLKKTVYMIRAAKKPVVGVVLAENIPDRGAAEMTVLCWLRGYKTGCDEYRAISA